MTTEAPVLDAAKLVLFDNWFGPAVRVRSLAFLSEPENRGTHYSFVRDNGAETIFVYLQAGSDIPSANMLCPPHLSEPIQYGVVTADARLMYREDYFGLFAVSIRPVASGERQWFWCGGHAPLQEIAQLSKRFPATCELSAGAVGYARRGNALVFAKKTNHRATVGFLMGEHHATA